MVYALFFGTKVLRLVDPTFTDAGDVIRTVWLPGAPLPCSASVMSFGAILRATMEGGSVDQPLILTFGQAQVF
jgi:hypothetical protein